jgi:uncharacterized protein (TIGR02391 family)
MAHIKISDLVPVAADLIGLEVEEVAGVLLVHLNSDPPANPGLYPYKNGNNVNYHSFCQAIHDKPPYGVKNDEVKTALMEAWGWLQSAGLLVPEDNWMFLSRRARRLTRRDEFRNYQNGRLLPKEQIHPLIAVRVYPAFLRGEYDTAIFQAFREVEIAIREAARIPEGTKGADVIRDAFRVANDKGPAGPLTDQSIPRGEQESMLLLFSGAFGFYRNSTGHRHVPTSPVGTAEVIMFASQLLRIVDELKP